MTARPFPKHIEFHRNRSWRRDEGSALKELLTPNGSSKTWVCKYADRCPSRRSSVVHRGMRSPRLKLPPSNHEGGRRTKRRGSPGISKTKSMKKTTRFQPTLLRFSIFLDWLYCEILAARESQNLNALTHQLESNLLIIGYNANCPELMEVMIKGERLSNIDLNRWLLELRSFWRANLRSENDLGRWEQHNEPCARVPDNTNLLAILFGVRTVFTQ